MDRRNFISSWDEIHTIIDDAMAKRDRSVSIYISPDSGMSITIMPWSEEQDDDEASSHECSCADGVCDIRL